MTQNVTRLNLWSTSTTHYTSWVDRSNMRHLAQGHKSFIWNQTHDLVIMSQTDLTTKSSTFHTHTQLVHIQKHLFKFLLKLSLVFNNISLKLEKNQRNFFKWHTDTAMLWSSAKHNIWQIAWKKQSTITSPTTTTLPLQPSSTSQISASFWMFVNISFWRLVTQHWHHN